MPNRTLERTDAGDGVGNEVMPLGMRLRRMLSRPSRTEPWGDHCQEENRPADATVPVF